MKQQNRKDLIPIVIVAALSIGIIVALVIAGKRDLTATESLLLGILLSAASMLVSWLVTHIYSQANLDDAIKQATDSNTENMRNYAVKAAEKVLNLSNELQRLIDALSGACDEADDLNGYKDSAVLLQERISAAVHNLETLRSMNDTFLSDWRGVIGEEIDRQIALEKQIESLADELDQQRTEHELLSSSVVSPDVLEKLEEQINETKQLLSKKMTALPFKVATPSPKKKRDIVVDCPSCEQANKVKFRRRKGARKLMTCSRCGCYSEVRGLDAEEIQVTVVGVQKYSEKCPLCEASIEGELPDFPGAMKRTTCGNCETAVLASRTNAGINVRLDNSSKARVPKRLADEVRKLLPERPWPTYIHKSIAKELGMSNNQVCRIISAFIEDGLYPLPADTATANTDSGDTTKAASSGDNET